MMAVMALLDLPWQSDQTHRFDPSGERGIEIIPNSNMMIFKKELQNTEFNQNESIMVIHRFFDENNRNSEMKIEEFLQQRIYGCEVIITNVSSSSQELQCLWQIPEGSVPLKNSNYQKSNSMTLKPYTTQTYEFYFYFPKTGKYIQFPSNISWGDVVIAKSRIYEFKVVSKKDSSNFERFSDLALSGDKEAILNFLKNENLFALQLKFHMKHLRPFLSDKKFYDRAIKIWRDRRIFGYDLWKFGFKHYDLQAVKELIETDDGIQVKVGTFFESSLIRCTPERNNFRYYDFFPMINSRAHKLDNEKSAAMLNVQFKEEYDKFLKNMIEKTKLNSTDHLFFCSYLLIQDRIEEALALFKKVSPKDFAGKKGQSLSIQYDYLQWYFDILVGYDSGFKVAREVWKKYEDYPVITWRMLFNEIIDQLKEFDGIEEHDSDIDLEDIDKKKENLKKSKKLEPTLDFNIEDKKWNIDYTNIESVTVKYYIVNPEILFTRAPFLIQNTEEFSYVKPVYQTIKSLPKKSTTFSFEINKDFENKNVIIEVDCGSKKVFQTYLSCALKVSIIENYAELKVTDSKGAPIPQVYIKAFAKHQNGEIKFFKDGYTDMRGKFEYGYNNTEKLTNIEKLSILVMSEKFGSVIKECKLPTMVVKDADVEFLNARQAQKYRKWSFCNKKKEKSKKKK